MRAEKGSVLYMGFFLVDGDVVVDEGLGKCVSVY